MDPIDDKLIAQKFEDAEVPTFSSQFTLDEAAEFGFTESALTEIEAREASLDD